MRLPWTSVARLDDARERLSDAQRDIEWLRARIEELEDKRERRARKEMGMSEAPREERPPMEPMPDELREYIKGHGAPNIQRMMTSTAYKRHVKGETWKSIMAATMTEEENGSEPA